MIENEVSKAATCEGPLVWFTESSGGAILECGACGYLIVAGSLFDDWHAHTPTLPEGLA